MNNTNQRSESTKSIRTITNALMEDLFNPSISTLDLCNLHQISLPELAATLESETFKQAVESFARINAARTSIIEPEAQALATARLADQLKDKPETPAHAETQRKAAAKVLSLSRVPRLDRPRQAVSSPNSSLLPRASGGGVDKVGGGGLSSSPSSSSSSPSPVPSFDPKGKGGSSPLPTKTSRPRIDKHLHPPTLCHYGTRNRNKPRRRRQANAMPLPLLLQLVSTCAIVTGSLCAILAYFRGSKSHQQTLNAQVYLTLTQRHASLIAFRRLEADQRLNDHWAGDLETAVAIREYFDLLSHEFALVDLGILDQRVWQIWQPDIARIVNTQLASQIWQKRTRHLHRTSPAFVSYIESLLTHQRGAFADGHSGSTLQISRATPIRA